MSASANRAAFGRAARRTITGLGLAALIGATAWKAASVSIWLAPAYLAALLMIFVTPRAARLKTSGRAAPSRSEVPTSPGAVDADAQANAETEGNAGPEAESETAVEAVDDDLASNGPGSPRRTKKGKARFDPDAPAETGPTKPRRSRARSRKTAQPAAMPDPDATAPVTWVRLGPGKFVRSDLAAALASSNGAGAGESDANGLATEGPAETWPEARSATETNTRANAETETAIAGSIPTDLETETTTETGTETEAPTETTERPERSTAAAPAEPFADALPPEDAPDADAARPALAAEHGIAPSAFSEAGQSPRPVLERSEDARDAVCDPARRDADNAVDRNDRPDVDVEARVEAAAPIGAAVLENVGVESAIDISVDVDSEARRPRAQTRAVFLGRAALKTRELRARSRRGPRAVSRRAARRGPCRQIERTRPVRHCRSPPNGRAGAQR